MVVSLQRPVTYLDSLTEVDPSNESVCVVTIFGINDIAETNDVHLDLSTTAGGIDREQDWPCYQTAEEAESHGNLQVSEEKKAVERMMVEHIAIGNLVEGANPFEQSVR